MIHIDSYKIFDSRSYRKRGYFGKVSDFIVGRKDMISIIEKDRDFAYRTYYRFDSGKISKIPPPFPERIQDEDHGEYGVKHKAFLKFKEENPKSFVLVGLNSYPTLRHTNIKLEILINDLIKSTNGQLEILWVDISSGYGDIKVNVTLRENGFQTGDGMPNDICNNYVNMIIAGLKNRRNEYLEKYNILQRQRTSQKMRHRSINLYSTVSLYMGKFENQNGLIKIQIDPML